MKDFRPYETVVILQPDLKAEFRNCILKQIEEIIAQQSLDSHIPYREEWGIKKIAYPIKKYSSGDYVVFDHFSTEEEAEIIDKRLESAIPILKHMSIEHTPEDETEWYDKIYKSESKSKTKSEQIVKIDAYDVLLGLASYEQKGE